MIDKITQYFLLLMLFSPLLSFISFGIMGLNPITYYFQLFTCVYGVLFLIEKRKLVKFTKIHFFLIGYITYIFIWSFFNGYFESKGIINVTNADNVSVFFMIIIIYNTSFSSKFIKNAILIIQLTVILATIASIIQVFNFGFLDAEPFWAKSELNSSSNIDLYSDRRNSIFGFVNANELGLSYLPLLSLLIGLLLYNNKRYYSFFLVLGGISSLLSNTRYVMIAFCIILLQVLITQKIKINTIIKYLFMFVLLSVILYKFLGFIGYNFEEWYNKRLLSEGSLKGTTRYFALINFLRFFPESPFFGTGVPITKEIQLASNEAGSSQIHIGYLSHLVSYGIVGSLMLFGFWFLLAKKLLKTAKLTRYYGSIFAFLIFLWANATLVKYTIFFYGIIFALVFDRIFSEYHFKSIKLKNSKVD